MEGHLKYWVWLSSLPRISPKKRKQLLEHYKDPMRIWGASEVELRRLPFLTQTNLDQLLSKSLREETEKHLEKIYRLNINVITLNDELYPSYLKNIYDPPIVLYVRGTIKKDEKAIAVVGSRMATPYGLSMAQTISSELCRYGLTVISGMARGIDSFAHSGALKAGGRTVAVLGCGLDIVYPSENKRLMEEIAAYGAVVSEYVPGVKPLHINFPARNRIISGASLGVVIIEAGERSGSLITANFALEQGREVFAVPGNVNSMNSKGTNKLIRDGAKIVTEIEDILEELKAFKNINSNNFNYKEVKKKSLYSGLDDEEIKIVEQLQKEQLHIDALAQKSGLSVQIVGSVLVMLELKGIIEQLPGKIFKLKE